MNQNLLLTIAVTLLKGCEDTKDFPFYNDLSGARRLLAMMDVDLDRAESVDCRLTDALRLDGVPEIPTFTAPSCRCMI